jgi:hypothetical protein
LHTISALCGFNPLRAIVNVPNIERPTCVGRQCIDSNEGKAMIAFPGQHMVHLANSPLAVVAIVKDAIAFTSIGLSSPHSQSVHTMDFVWLAMFHCFCGFGVGKTRLAPLIEFNLFRGQKCVNTFYAMWIGGESFHSHSEGINSMAGPGNNLVQVFAT